MSGGLAPNAATGDLRRVEAFTVRGRPHEMPARIVRACGRCRDAHGPSSSGCACARLAASPFRTALPAAPARPKQTVAVGRARAFAPRLSGRPRRRERGARRARHSRKMRPVRPGAVNTLPNILLHRVVCSRNSARADACPRPAPRAADPNHDGARGAQHEPGEHREHEHRRRLGGDCH